MLSKRMDNEMMIFKLRLFIPEVKFRCENNGKVNNMVHKLGAVRHSRRTNHRVWQFKAQNKCFIGCEWEK